MIGGSPLATRRFRRRAVVVVSAAALALALGVAPADASLSVKRNDYNRDGNGDIVGLPYPALDCLFRWDGTGGGGFSSGAQVGCGWSQYFGLTAVGDINRDRVGDLVAEDANGFLHAWYGNGSGGFQQPRALGPGWGANGRLFGVGDLNRDGNGDLVAINHVESQLYLWTGNGSGGVNPGTRLQFFSRNWELA
jgi:hypothetical protein